MAIASGTGPTVTAQPSIHSRRHLMRLAAAGGISLAALKMFSPATAFAASTAAATGLTGGPTDGATQFAAIPGNSINEKVLNFALTLEIIEADLYRQALKLACGYELTSALKPDPNVYQRRVDGGGLSKGATAIGFLYLKQYAYVEAAHRDFLTMAMKAAGFTPVTPNPAGYGFVTKPAANIKSILQTILPLEETGTRAYLGALPYLTDLGLAVTAGQIYSQECRHSAAIAYTLGLDPGPGKLSGDLEVVANPPANNTFEPYLAPSTVVAAVQPFFLK